jgi:hypothetical protein
VDFIMLKNLQPWFAVEVKESAQSLDPNLKYLLTRVKFKYAFQVHLNGDDDYRVEDINGCKVYIMPASRLLSILP